MNAADLRALQAPLKDQYDTLLRFTERCCVADRTFANSPALSVQARRAAS